MSAGRSNEKDVSDNERGEGGAEAASEVPASAKWVLGHQQPPFTPDDSPRPCWEAEK